MQLFADSRGLGDVEVHHVCFLQSAFRDTEDIMMGVKKHLPLL